MKTVNKSALVLVIGWQLGCSAAIITMDVSLPSVGDGVQNLAGAASTLDNTQVLFADSNYLSGQNNGVLGQTFTTGSNPMGYYLTSISFQQVPYSTWWWTGGTIGYRIFQTVDMPASGVQQMTVLVADSGTVPTAAPGIQNGAPGANAFWVTIEIPPSAPLLLQPDTQYGFDIQALGSGGTGPFFMEWNGTSADAFGGGQAFINGTPQNPSPATIWLGDGPSDGDRVFVAAMTEAVLPMLQLEAQPETLSINISANRGRWYGLEYTDSLQPATWQKAWTGSVMAFDSTFLIEGSTASESDQRFYRMQETNGAFAAFAGAHGLTSLRPADDGSDTNYVAAEFIAPGRQLGNATMTYQPLGGSAWNAVDTSTLNGVASSSYQQSATTNGTRNAYHYVITNNLAGSLQFESALSVDQDDIEWRLSLTNASADAVIIGDLAVPLPMNTDYQSPSTSVFKHSFISGNGSWIFWMRPDAVGPYLTMTTDPSTKLEYWDGPGARGEAYTYKAYIHSAVAAEIAEDLGSEWRQPNTSLTLAPGESKSYGFKFRWADDFDAVRQVLVDEGKIDIHVVPGMTVPTNLAARIALHTTQTIDSVEAEFPTETQIQFIGNNGLHKIYEVEFSRLGENLLTINYGGDQQMVLEFFATEPLEILINKRAQFLVDNQINDAAKWYDGVYPEWNMATQTQVTPDNYYLIPPVYQYIVTADDAGLSRPAFLALKNASMPDQTQVDSLDKYINDFVWGGLQRTTEETYSFGIYGVRDWYGNRNSSNTGIWGQLHIWRTYDYPHITTMYRAMYRIAKNNPQITTLLSATEYLERAYGTAIAMFTIPYSVWPDDLWIPYHTGYMNESVIPGLIEDLEAEGMTAEAADLRAEWDQKVNYFVFTASDLFASEMTFDSTGFESQQAIARYAVENAASLDPTNAAAYEMAASQFMNKVTMANATVRGWLETAYYHYGSDFRGNAGDSYTLSYMSQLGGWGILDYALHFSTNAAPYLRLGYGSYLSSWALMNTGTAASEYGYWYPGAANDGACGGGFEPSPYNDSWMELPIRRGSWYYGCEEDLGFCGAMRAAATILVDDPIFGRFCYGGDWQQSTNMIRITPKDGVRQRFHAMLDSGRLHLQLENDRFAESQSIDVAEDLSQVIFELTTPNPAAHDARLVFSVSIPGNYEVSDTSGTITNLYLPAGEEAHLDLPFSAGAGTKTFSITLQ